MKTPLPHDSTTVLSRIRRSRWRLVVQSFAMAGLILQPVPMAHSYWTDTDNNGAKDWVDDPDPVDAAAWYAQDSDGDGLTNGEEVIYGSDPYRLDSDFDGLTDKDEHDLTPLNDPWNWSSDGSGYSDHDRYYHDLQGAPLSVNYNTLIAAGQVFYSFMDADGDGVQNQDDPDPLNLDRDGDGLLNWQDSYMDDPENVGTPPDTTTDSDADGIPDYSDPFPYGSYVYNDVEYGGVFVDTDADSIPDQLDPFPNGSYVYDGVEYDGTLIDSDNDGVPDPADPFPDGSYWYEGVEYAGAKIDSDNDGIPDPFDSFPNGSYIYNGVEYAGAWIDSDHDGIPDAFDTSPDGYTYNGVFYSGTWADRDNDGIPDPADLFPNGSYLYNGTEYAGCWVDQDNDGIPDPQDAFPTLPGSFWYGGIQYGGSWADADEDGLPDPADPWPTIAGSYTYNNTAYPGTWTDADNDGIPDPADPFPAGSYTYNGTEYGGTWTDSDGDNIPDPADTFPQIAGSFWYNGTEYGGTWVDTDGDTIPDPADAYPYDKWNGQPYFTYNGVEYAGTWNDRDNDGVPDPADSWPDDPENGLDSDHDGLDNYTERTVTHTDPNNNDSDHDYLTDGEEALTYHSNPLNPRSVQMGQTVLDYVAVGATTDSDGDGIPDAIERHHATIQSTPDTWLDPNGDLDGDGVTNLQAYSFGWDIMANMNQYDQDGDGITDVVEDSLNVRFVDPGTGQDLWARTPMDKTKFADAVGDLDGDGLLNIEEIKRWGTDLYGRVHLLAQCGTRGGNARAGDNLRLHDWNAAIWLDEVHSAQLPETGSYSATNLRNQTDANHNGFPDGYECWLSWRASRTKTYTQVTGTVPYLDDIDGDGMSNEWEYRYHFDFRNPADAGPATGVTSPARISATDADGDGLSNLQEFRLHTNPRIADSDGDGFSDGVEVAMGTDPTLHLSYPGTTTTGTPPADPLASGIRPGTVGDKPAYIACGWGVDINPTTGEKEEIKPPVVWIVASGSVDYDGHMYETKRLYDYTYYPVNHTEISGHIPTGRGDDPGYNVFSSSGVPFAVYSSQWLDDPMVHHDVTEGWVVTGYEHPNPYTCPYDPDDLSKGYRDECIHPLHDIRAIHEERYYEHWDNREIGSGSVLIKASGTWPEPITATVFKSISTWVAGTYPTGHWSDPGPAIPIQLVIEPDTTESLSEEIKPAVGEKIAVSVGPITIPQTKPVEEPPSGFKVTASDAAGPKYRRISLQGFPLSDSPPSVRPGASENPEETYIDALGLELRQSVADVKVPLASSLLNLEVKRELIHETWSGASGMRPHERPDRPFGVGWRSNLAACIQVTEIINDNKPDHVDATVTDVDGGSHSFISNDRAAWVETVQESNTTKTRHSTLSVSYEAGTQVASSAVYGKTDGTVCYYDSINAPQMIMTPAELTKVQWLRLSRAVDRWGSTIVYEYSDTHTHNALIPSAIYRLGDPDQRITVTQDGEGHVTAVQGPDGRRTSYAYAPCMRDEIVSPLDPGPIEEQHLSSVTRPGGGSIHYQFTVRTEEDPMPDGNDAELIYPSQHALLRSFKDANSNEYKFDYVFNSIPGNNGDDTTTPPTLNKPNFEYHDGGFGRARPQISLPPLVTAVTLPNQSVATFTARKHILLGAMNGYVGIEDCRAETTSVAVNGKEYRWAFTQPGLCSPVRAWPVGELSDMLGGNYTLFFQTMTVTSPLGTETYEFDFGAEMAVRKITDFSGNVTEYTYGHGFTGPVPLTPSPERMWNVTGLLDSAGTPALYVNYASDQPTSVKDALNRITTFEYASDSLELKKTTDPAGVVTEYGLQYRTGLRTSKTIKQADGTVVQQIEYNYLTRPACFKAFMNRETVKALAGDPQQDDRITNYLVDEHGRVGRSFQIVNGAALNTFFGYDWSNRKRWVKDPNGNVTEWRYDAAGCLETVIYPDCGDGQKFVRFEYDPAGNRTLEINENGVKTFHLYDALQRKYRSTVDLDGNGVAGTRAQDLVTDWTYNAMNLVKTITDPRGFETWKEYDEIGRPKSETVAKGTVDEATTFFVFGANSGGSVFDVSGFKPTQIIAPHHVEGSQMIYSVTGTDYDALYRPLHVSRAECTRDANGNLTVVGGRSYGTTATEYDVAGNPWRVTDPLNKVTTTLFDALKRPYQVDYADSTEAHPIRTKTWYTSSGQIYQTEDEMGRQTNTSYDAIGRKTSVKQPETFDGYGERKRPETTFSYDFNGNLIDVTDPLGNVTTTYYDARNRPWMVRSPAVYDPVLGTNIRPTVSTRYDGVGNKVQVTDPLGNVTDTYFDRANRAYEVHAPPVPVAGSNVTQRPVTQTSYDANGNVLTVTDANTITTTNTYDARNRLSSTVDGAGITVSFGYDAAGNRTSVTDGKSQTTTFTYDGLNRVLTETIPATNTAPPKVIVTNAYNALNKIARMDGKGEVTAYAYDDRHRLLAMTYLGSGKTRVYLYDDCGRISGVGESDAPGSAVAYLYDELGRTVAETSQGVVHLHTYDLAGHELVRQNQSTGRRIDRYYDGAGRLVMIHEGGRQTSLYYDLCGRVAARRMGNGTWAGLNYDALGRVLISTTYQSAAQDPNAILFEHEWDYDLAGNVREQREKWNTSVVPDRPDGTRITAMEYDGAYRLTKESISDPGGGMTVTDYTYDAANNRATKTVTGGEEPGAWTYTSNARNQLTGFTRQSGATGPVAVTYTYDDNGNRTTKVAQASSLPSDTTTDIYTWDEENRLTQVDKDGATHHYGYDYRTRRISREEPKDGTTVKTAVVFAGGLSVAEFDYTSTGLGGIDQQHPTVEYVRGPDLGGGVGGMLYSLRAVVGASSPDAKYSYPNGRGDVVAQANQAREVTWTASYEAFGTHKKETGTNLDRQRANTKEEDPTGLLNEGFRYRDLETGIWLSRDPAGFVDGPNLYAYVRCNPWTKWDPHGLWEFEGDPRESGRAFTDSSGYTHITHGDGERGSSVPNRLQAQVAELFANSGSNQDRAAQKLRDHYPPSEAGNVGRAMRDQTDPDSARLRSAAMILGADEMMHGVGGIGRNNFARANPSEAPSVPGKPATASPKPASESGALVSEQAHTKNTSNSGGTSIINRPDYSDIADPPSAGPGKPFTASQKEQILRRNSETNGGVLRSDKSGDELVPSSQSKRGVTPPANEAQVDHVTPQSKDGPNSSSNAQVLSREENRDKSDK